MRCFAKYVCVSVESQLQVPPAVDDSGEAKDVLVEDVPVESELQEAAGSAQIPAPAPGDV